MLVCGYVVWEQHIGLHWLLKLLNLSQLLHYLKITRLVDDGKICFPLPKLGTVSVNVDLAETKESIWFLLPFFPPSIKSFFFVSLFFKERWLKELDGNATWRCPSENKKNKIPGIICQIVPEQDTRPPQIRPFFFYQTNAISLNTI